MPRINRSIRVRKREAYVQMVREVELVVLEETLHAEWQHDHAERTATDAASDSTLDRPPAV